VARSSLLPLVEELLLGPEQEVQLAVLQQLPSLGRALLGSPCAAGAPVGASSAGPAAVAQLLQHAQPWLLAEDDDVSSGAMAISSQLLQLLQPASSASLLSTTATALLGDGGAEAGAAAIKLLRAASGLLQPEQLLLLLGAQLQACCSPGGDLDARMAAAACLLPICSGLAPQDFQQHALPLLRALSRDPVWKVRRELCSSICSACSPDGSSSSSSSSGGGGGSRRSSSHPLGPQQRLGAEALRHLGPLLLALVEDGSNWVRPAAAAALGPWLGCLPAAAAPTEALHAFAAAAIAAAGSVLAAARQVATSCSRSLPGVATAAGAARWPALSPAYLALLASEDDGVAGLAAAAAPAMSAQLGPAIGLAEVLPPALATLQQRLHALSQAVLPRLGALLQALPPEQHGAVLQLLPALAAAPAAPACGSWRSRQQLARQLGAMAAEAGPEAVAGSIWACAMQLCNDPVAAVREAAAAQVGPLLGRLASGCAAGDGVGRERQAAPASSSSRHDCGAAGVEALLAPLLNLSRGSSYLHRQQFAQACSSLWELPAGSTPAAAPIGLCGEALRPALEALCGDRVWGVRAAAGLALRPWQQRAQQAAGVS
jgi:hypothetical protein